MFINYNAFEQKHFPLVSWLLQNAVQAFFELDYLFFVREKLLGLGEPSGRWTRLESVQFQVTRTN